MTELATTHPTVNQPMRELSDALFQKSGAFALGGNPDISGRINSYTNTEKAQERWKTPTITGVVTGIRNAPSDLLDAFNHTVNDVGTAVGLPLGQMGQSDELTPALYGERTPDGAARISSQMTQVIGLMATGGGLIHSAESLGGKLLTSAAIAGGSDFLTYRQGDQRFSNLLADLTANDPDAGHALWDYMSAKPGEEPLKGRIMSSIEGSAIGLAVDGLFESVKAVKAVRLAKSAAERTKLLEAAWPGIQDAMQAASERGVANPTKLDYEAFRSVRKVLSDAKIDPSKYPGLDTALESHLKQVVKGEGGSHAAYAWKDVPLNVEGFVNWANSNKLTIPLDQFRATGNVGKVRSGLEPVQQFIESVFNAPDAQKKFAAGLATDAATTDTTAKSIIDGWIHAKKFIDEVLTPTAEKNQDTAYRLFGHVMPAGREDLKKLIDTNDWEGVSKWMQENSLHGGKFNDVIQFIDWAHSHEFDIKDLATKVEDVKGPSEGAEEFSKRLQREWVDNGRIDLNRMVRPDYASKPSEIGPLFQDAATSHMEWVNQIPGLRAAFENGVNLDDFPILKAPIEDNLKRLARGEAIEGAAAYKPNVTPTNWTAQAVKDWADGNGIDLSKVDGLGQLVERSERAGEDVLSKYKNIDDLLGSLKDVMASQGGKTAANVTASESKASIASVKTPAGVSVPDAKATFGHLLGDASTRADLLKNISDRIKDGAPVVDSIEDAFLNLTKWDVVTDAKRVQNAVADFLSEAYSKLENRTTLDSLNASAARFVDDMASAAGYADNNKLMAAIARRATDAKQMAIEVQAARMTLTSMSTEIANSVAKKVFGGNASPSDVLEMLVKLDHFGDLMGNFIAFKGGVGRALRVMREDVNPEVIQATVDRISNTVTGLKGVKELLNKTGLREVLDEAAQKNLPVSDVIRQAIDTGKLSPDALDEIIRMNGGMKNLKDLAQRISMSGGAPSRLRSVLEPSLGRKIINIVNEVHINSLLSNPVSAGVDTISNAIKTVLMPAERIIGGAVSGRMDIARQGFAMYAGMTQFMGDALRAAASAFRAGDSILDRTFRSWEITPAIKDSTFKLQGTTAGEAINWLGNVVRLPSRFRAPVDEFFKVLNFRAHLKMELTDLAMKTGQKDVARFVSEGMESLNNPRSVDESTRALYTKAMEYARAATFQTKLTGFWSIPMDIAQKHPALRLVMPFIRTPINLVNDAVHHTPAMEALRMGFWRDISEGGAKRADAIGRLATGTLMWTTAIALALEGRITGQGPASSGLRENEREAGWQPYSFVTFNSDGTKSYTRFSRMDPYAMLFGMAADFVNISGTMPNESASEIMSAGAMSAAHSINNKTWLVGLTQLLDAVTNPDHKMKRYLQNLVSGFVPAAFNAMPDEHLRETRGLLDGAIAKVPGLRDSLPLRYDPLSQPIKNVTAYDYNNINPMAVSRENNQAMKILADTDRSWSSPSDGHGDVKFSGFRNKEGVDAYTRYNQLVSTMKLGGKTLEDSIISAADSQKFKSLPAHDITNDLTPTGRIAILQGIIDAYRHEAESKLMSEFPEIAKALMAQRQSNARGRIPAVLVPQSYSNRNP